MTRLRATWLALTLVASVGAACPAEACPDCATGREARAQVWGDDFGVDLLLGLAPFLIIGAISAWANRIGQSHEARHP